MYLTDRIVQSVVQCTVQNTVQYLVLHIQYVCNVPQGTAIYCMYTPCSDTVEMIFIAYYDLDADADRLMVVSGLEFSQFKEFLICPNVAITLTRLWIRAENNLAFFIFTFVDSMFYLQKKCKF